MQHRQRLDGHPGPDTPRVDQAAIRLVVAEQQRTDEMPRALRVRPSDDDKLRAVEALAFDPGATIARQIGPVCPLGDDALKGVLAGGPPERLAVAALMLAVDDPGGRILEERCQPILAFDQTTRPCALAPKRRRDVVAASKIYL